MNWRKRSALVAVVAALLSIVMVTPAVAEGEWTPDPAKFNAETRYKYGYEYYKKEMINGKAWTYKLGDKIPVTPQVNPSAPKPISPTSGTPLTGKIIEPGKTIVRIPSTYGPVTAFAHGTAGALGWSRLLGGVGVGIGGTSLPPANRVEIAQNQGVTTGCATGTNQCTSAEIQKLFMIDSCGQLSGAQSCSSIGAVGSLGETDLQKWFANDALPFLEDLWAKITGQRTSDIDASLHQKINKSWGCSRELGMELRPDNQSIQYHNTGYFQDGARPTSGGSQAYWDAACSTTSRVEFNIANSNIESVCVDPKGSAISPTGVPYGRAFAGLFANITTGITGNLCTGNVGASYTNGQPVLVKARIWNSGTAAADYKGPQNPSTTNYEVLKTAVEYINPDPSWDTIEDTKITTNWDCRTNDGSYTYSFSKTVTKTPVAVAPACPPGSQLVKHDIKLDAPGTAGDATLDAGEETPGAAAQYPGCLGAASMGCTLQILVDGQPCTATRTDCQKWPAVSGITPSRVQCQWGTYAVPLANCTALSNAYQTESGVVFDPRAGTWVAVDSYGQPVQPNPEPWNPVNPNPAVGTTPGTATPPGTGTGTGTPGFPVTGTSPASDNCSAPSWSWNPVEWVKNPVVCALVDTFVPKTDVAARMTTIQSLATTHPPFSWFQPVLIGPSGSGCPDWTISIPGVMEKNVVCESSFTAAIVGARTPMFTLLSAAMVWPLIRSLWYAAIPILRVTPSSGGKS